MENLEKLATYGTQNNPEKLARYGTQNNTYWTRTDVKLVNVNQASVCFFITITAVSFV
jgi:hypothetical protein